MRINEELMEIWLNEVCDKKAKENGNGQKKNKMHLKS